jgi:quercetin dioxygenase-like cupin family protein
VDLQVVEHRLRDGETLQLGPAHRILYNVAGNDAEYSDGARAVTGPLHALAFELVRAPSDQALLSAPLEVATQEELLIRCDRVDFPSGGVAYTHTHQGPGVRVLLSGTIRIETGGSSRQYGPLQAWFEPGPEPVFAAASETEPTAFVRCMVLPARLLGQSSIRYVRDEDAAKPKPQRYTVFVDQPLGAL